MWMMHDIVSCFREVSSMKLSVSPLQESYCALLDSLDSGCGAEPPEVPSSLPGLKRTAYLASQTQLNDLVREGGEGEGMCFC